MFADTHDYAYCRYLSHHSRHFNLSVDVEVLALARACLWAIAGRRSGHVEPLLALDHVIVEPLLALDHVIVVNLHEVGFIVACKGCAGRAVCLVTNDQIEFRKVVLLLGIGDHDEVLMDENLKEELLTTVMRLKRDVKVESEKSEEKIKQIISDVETLKTLKTFSDTFSSSNDFKEVKKNLPPNILEKLSVPVLGFAEKKADEIAGTIEKFVASVDLFKVWIQWNLNRLAVLCKRH